MKEKPFTAGGERLRLHPDIVRHGSGIDAGEIERHQATIIDKNYDVMNERAHTTKRRVARGSMFAHATGKKGANSLAPESHHVGKQHPNDPRAA